MYYVFFHVIQ